jgi:hypothetical protein
MPLLPKLVSKTPAGVNFTIEKELLVVNSTCVNGTIKELSGKDLQRDV